MNVEHNVQSYQREIRDIKSKLAGESLSFLESFLESDCRLFCEQIQADLGYFGHGSDLLEKAMNAIRGRVEIEQAERDRNLQKTIQAVGFGIGVAGVVATSAPYPYWIKQEPGIININKPFSFSALATFILIIFLSLVTGLFTWKVATNLINRKQINKKVKLQGDSTQNQASLTPGQSADMLFLSQQRDKAR